MMAAKEDPLEIPAESKSVTQQVETKSNSDDCDDHNDKKPGRKEADDIEAPPPARLDPPSYQKVQRCGNNDGDAENAKVCRICLEDDLPEQMIAPCRCKGGSKWVHRFCLDEWRTNEKDRAFSKCTECLFDYRMEPVNPNKKNRTRRRNVQFSLLVSRDICLLTILFQAIIAILGGLIYLFDQDQYLAQVVNNGDRLVAAYYLFGWLALLIILGIYGSCMLCQNGCSPSRALANHNQSRRREENVTGNNRSAAYRQRRHEYERTCFCCYGGPHYYPHPVYCYGGGDGASCCCCCGDDNDQNRSTGASGHTSSDCGGCCNCDVGGDGGGGDCGEALLVVLLVAAIFMAIIGFLVGIVVCVVAFQRILQRHVYLLQKRQLVQEFQVMDLAGFNLDHPAPSAPPETGLGASCTAAAEDLKSDLESQPIPEPEIKVDPQNVLPATKLCENDAQYLKKLGLME